MDDVLAFVAGGLVGLWGVAHAIPTPRVVAGFEPMTRDNRHVLVQEWLAESFTMWGIAALVVATAAVGDGATSDLVYRISACLLVAIAALTALTGARTPVIWFRICPVLLGTSAVLLLVASFV